MEFPGETTVAVAGWRVRSEISPKISPSLRCARSIACAATSTDPCSTTYSPSDCAPSLISISPGAAWRSLNFSTSCRRAAGSKSLKRGEIAITLLSNRCR